MDQDDPADWSIDRVVRELCHVRPPAWFAGTDLKLIVNPEVVSRAFRENDIDGDNLLALEDADIRSDLGITSFGQRRALKNIIEHLRNLSVKYRVQMNRTSRPLFATPQLSHTSLKSYGYSPGYAESTIKTSIETNNGEASTANHDPDISSRQSSAVSLTKRKHEDLGSPTREFSGAATTESQVRLGPIVHMATDLPRTTQGSMLESALPSAQHAPFQYATTSISVHNEGSRVPLFNDLGSATSQDIEAVESSANEQPTVRTDGSNPTSFQSQPKKTPKRAVLIPVTDVTAENFQPSIAMSADKHTAVSEATQKQLPATFVESDIHSPPTKRVRLASMSLSNRQNTSYANSVDHYGVASRHGSLRSDQIGKQEANRSVRRDTSEESLNPEFFFINSAKPVGRMHRGVPQARRDDFAPSKSSRASDDFPEAVNPARVQEGTGSDLSPDLLHLLQKYPVNEDDVTLPVYGESDEEDRMWTPEVDTPPPEDQSMRDVMTRNEVDTVIETSLEGFRADWHIRCMPKAQIKAHRKWMTAAKNPSMHRSMLEECRQWQTRTENRILQLRKGIHLSEWRRAEDVSQQCLALEISMHQFQEFSFYVDVLECEQEPSPPPLTAIDKSRNRPRTIMENGDEELHSDSEDSFVIADDGNNGTLSPRLLASADQENRIWTPKFAENTNNLAQQQNSEQVVQHLSQEMAIDSVEGVDQTATPNRSIKQRGEAVHLADKSNANVLPVTPASKKQQRLINRQKAQESAVRNPMLLPEYTESEEEDSDLDRSPRLPATKHRKQGRTRDTAIDLTLLSSPSRSERTNSTGAHTPKFSTDGGLISEDQQHRVTHPRAHSHEKRSMPRLSTQSSHSPPTIYDVKRVSNMSWDDIEPSDGDQPIDVRLALAKSVYDLKTTRVHNLLDYVKSFRDDFEMREVLQNGLSAVIDEEEQIDDVEQKNQRNAWGLTDLFVSYATGYRVDIDEGWSEDQANDAHGLLEDGLPDFRQLLQHLLQRYADFLHTVSMSDHLSTDDLSADADTEFDDAPTYMNKESPFKRRKRKVVQSKDVLAQQRDDLETAKQQEKERAKILKKKAEKGIDQGKLSVSINIKEPLVYLDSSVADDIKPHQIEGIRFMWREIVENPRAQGCLLAHTMGLGKTMQVVSLLALIAQCNASTDQSIRNHIPQHLQRLKILIICPWALIQNWFEELIKWLPDPMMLGVITKLDKDIKQPEVTLEGWSKRGGVLIIGYEKFRQLVHVPPNSRTDGQDHLKHRRILLEDPAIVIADEAHKLKNATSGVNRAAHQIVTKSRIAMTGSPLNNHLEEYHTMIDWISPRYLGNMVQFKSKYVEPISRGLYNESTSWERRTCMKKLHVLKKIIAPKINRADITTIAKDLPPKTEFFLTITLTKEQKAAYQIYVEYMRGSSKQDKLGNAMVWSWLGVLSLLLNHPSCFLRKLKERNESDAKEISRRSRTGSEDCSRDSDAVLTPVEDENATKLSLLSNTLNKVSDVFEEARVLLGMDDPSLSNKSFLIKLILEEAVQLNEKTLIFSKSIPTLNYYEAMIKDMGLGYKRIDGTTSSAAGSRQRDVADFNESSALQVFLISTRAGGLGLNIQSATRVIINDFDFNPAWEEQAVGRAYRIGQTRPVFVYRFLVGGTFEELIHNKAVFKTQLFTRVVDEKNVISQAAKSPGEFLFDPKEVPQKNFDDCLGKDPHILDRILSKVDFVRNIFLTETFFQDDDEELNEQDLKEADEELELDRLEREDPAAYRIAKMRQRQPIPPIPKSGSMPPPQVPWVDNTFQHCSHFFNPRVQVQPGSTAGTFSKNVMRFANSHGPRQHLVQGSFDDAFVGQTNIPSLLRDDHAIPSTAPAISLANSVSGVASDGRRSSPYFVSFINGQISDSSRAITSPVVQSASNQPVTRDDGTGHESVTESSSRNALVDKSSIETVQGDNQAQENRHSSEPASGCRPQ